MIFKYSIRGQGSRRTRGKFYRFNRFNQSV